MGEMNTILYPVVVALLVGILVGGRIKLPEVKKFGNIRNRIKKWYEKNEADILYCIVLVPFYFGLIFVPVGRFAINLSWIKCFIPMVGSLVLTGLIMVFFATKEAIKNWKKR